MKLYCDPPRLDWRETGPVAPDFGDIYFSVEDGLEESRAVFLNGCGLPESWQGCDHFVIGELGFGTGLNFLAAWDLWKKAGPQEGWLHFISIEKFPLRVADARRALSAWPELAALSDQLLEQWPQPLKGAHRLRFNSDRVTLTLFQDDIASALPQTEACVDAWFLDGFSPASNEAMWAGTVWPEIARLSRKGTRAASFTVAGAVRRGLQGAGFAVGKKPGYGRKRERLEAVFDGPVYPSAPTPFPRLLPKQGPAVIRGGGIAGASLAHALRQRGREAFLIDPDGLAGGASGAPSGLLTPRLENADRPHVRATLAAFEYARQLYSDLGLLEAEGAMRLLENAGGVSRYAAIAEAMGEGYEVGEGGLWMARAGRFSPADIVRTLAGDRQVITEPETVMEASLVIDCRGPVAALDHISPGAGRVMVMPGEPPAHSIVWGGYVSATNDHRVLIGATHEKSAYPGPEAEARDHLLADLEQHCPDIASGLRGNMEHWSGVRATTPDRLPVSGALPGYEFDTVWRAYARGGPVPADIDPDTKPQIILSGLGSRGFAHAPLLAESIAADLCGEPSPLEKQGREALHPARFRFRELKRGD
ncbi:tRNA (5-methylaminomethyl-2-thiouridine)(34)-methyltransferase MnmD [Hyphobacterium sp. HN65]|uniref:tRNA 5-methylaminomethyl-2-thiouridine biosynthesis bifunctional protein MnmC n=1 Tax=Hyphobacterium lacteum TaxID=3116575 RepID=A0ABU7LPL5_9PROT|nr:tRNA (5-methylaminomethyl-2-thiouridine)(34)-methyltransferase MnmD [Hyphobacterium sp. HN65]MEE2525823.1 tRNA (5-methylaminomethyl-2-thiouridine)(34)-methyltransferase MnmD [Hyphobacterium sp. HN65]